MGIEKLIQKSPVIILGSTLLTSCGAHKEVYMYTDQPTRAFLSVRTPNTYLGPLVDWNGNGIIDPLDNPNFFWWNNYIVRPQPFIRTYPRPRYSNNRRASPPRDVAASRNRGRSSSQYRRSRSNTRSQYTRSNMRSNSTYTRSNNSSRRTSSGRSTSTRRSSRSSKNNY